MKNHYEINSSPRRGADFAVNAGPQISETTTYLFILGISYSLLYLLVKIWNALPSPFWEEKISLHNTTAPDESQMNNKVYTLHYTTGNVLFVTRWITAHVVHSICALCNHTLIKTTRCLLALLRLFRCTGREFSIFFFVVQLFVKCVTVMVWCKKESL